MADVRLVGVNKIFPGTQPVPKRWWELWKPSHRRSEVHVVRDLNLAIRDGEFLVLVGPSGCGKSTTLRMVAGLEEASSGDIYIGERRVNDVSPKDRDIAMVFQNYALYPHMTVYQNMAFGLQLRKFPPQEIEQRVRQAADLLGIGELLHRKPKELSGGQRQRVAMGRAIVRKPHVYLMDEPLSNLDAKLRVQMRAELQKLHRRLGVTTIYVTHDQTEAMTLGERIVVMKDGMIQQVDTPLRLYERPANQYVAGFIGSPSMNFLPARLEKNDGRLAIVTSGFRLEVPPGRMRGLEEHAGKALTLGIRPEDIYDRQFARKDAPLAGFRARVEVFEPMGSEVYLYLSSGEDTLIARVDAHTAARVGEIAELVVDMRKFHLFDPESQEALVNASPEGALAAS